MARFGKSYVRKCANCCPDGGACFTATCDDNGKAIWKCNNCHLIQPRRVNKLSGKPTPSQRSALNKLLQKPFAILKENKLIGRDLFVSVSIDRNNVFLDEDYTGVIGPSGKVKITRYYFMGSEKINKAYRL